MAKVFLARSSRIFSIITQPAVLLLLHRSRRSRVIVRYGDKVLLVRSRLGKQHWALPGGGIHRREAPEDGAAREVKEEVGISISPKKLKLLHQLRHYNNSWQYVDFWLYEVTVNADSFTPHKTEILEAAWFNKADMPAGISDFTRRVALPFIKQ